MLVDTFNYQGGISWMSVLYSKFYDSVSNICTTRDPISILVFVLVSCHLLMGPY